MVPCHLILSAFGNLIAAFQRDSDSTKVVGNWIKCSLISLAFQANFKATYVRYKEFADEKLTSYEFYWRMWNSLLGNKQGA